MHGPLRGGRRGREVAGDELGVRIDSHRGEHPAADRVEIGLGELPVAALADPVGVDGLRGGPHQRVLGPLPEEVGCGGREQFHACFVEVQPLRGVLDGSCPFPPDETLLRPARHPPEVAQVAVEGLLDGPRTPGREEARARAAPGGLSRRQ